MTKVFTVNGYKVVVEPDPDPFSPGDGDEEDDSEEIEILRAILPEAIRGSKEWREAVNPTKEE